MKSEFCYKKSDFFIKNQKFYKTLYRNLYKKSEFCYKKSEFCYKNQNFYKNNIKFYIKIRILL